MAHILGFPNDSDLIQPSIFNAGNQLLQSTALDRILVRARDTPTLKPGMPRRRAVLAAGALLRE